jgi:hypothetical protein
LRNLRGTVKRARESSDNDSDDNLDNGSSSTGSLVDKRIKLEQPSGVQLNSIDTRPIKATKLALDTIRANEIAIENSKTGKVTAVMAILLVFGDNTHNSRNANPGKLINSQYMNSYYNMNSYSSNSYIRIRSSERLVVNENTIRVLLDTGSSGDLLFIRKGSQEYIPT